MCQSVMRGWARTFVGAGLFVVGCFGAIVAALSVIDPVGVKLADDADPLGTPDPWYVGILIASVYAACAVVGVWLLRFWKRKEQ